MNELQKEMKKHAKWAMEAADGDSQLAGSLLVAWAIRDGFALIQEALGEAASLAGNDDGTRAEIREAASTIASAIQRNAGKG